MCLRVYDNTRTCAFRSALGPLWISLITVQIYRHSTILPFAAVEVFLYTRAKYVSDISENRLSVQDEITQNSQGWLSLLKT